MKRILAILSAALAVTAAAVIAAGLLINARVVSTTGVLIKDSPDGLAKAQAAVLLGAGVYGNKRVSPVAYDRIVSAVEIYKAGKAEKILITGDHGKKYYDEVNTILHWLRKFDIPEKDIFTDYAGFSTYDSIVRAGEVFGVKSAVLVTQEFHLPRALYIASSRGMKVQGYPADRRQYVYIRRYVFREYMARVKDFLFVHVLKPAPRFLGEKIPITGDGRASRDHKTSR